MGIYHNESQIIIEILSFHLQNARCKIALDSVAFEDCSQMLSHFSPKLPPQGYARYFPHKIVIWQCQLYDGDSFNS